jgi:Uma2 family endonuclease
MVGVSRAHNAMTLNLATRLRAELKGGPCQVFVVDLKLRIRPARAYYYPDVVVTCEADDTDPYVVEAPRLVVEVLSPSTEATDRREKLLAYQQLESLREYILVSQSRKRVEVYRRDSAGAWWHDEYEDPEAEIQLESVGVVVSLAEIYEGVTVSGT